MKRLFLFGLAIGTILALMAGPLAAADNGVTEIISPSADEMIVQNDLVLVADTKSGETTTVNWAVRESRDDLCDWTVGTPEVDSASGVQTDEDGVFRHTLDISEVDAGKYCFAIHPLDPWNERVVQHFYIVDHYVKAGGVVTVDDEDVEVVGNGTHAFEGWVADAGDAGLLGDIEVNYRGLGDTCTFTPTSLALDSSIPGTGVRATIGTDVSGCDMDPESATFFVGESDEWDRGGIVVRPSGSTDPDPYLIDNTPGTTGGPSWVPLTHGNAYIISR